ncbi:hypothetical protein D3C85_557620 [compost metagenome]
MPILDFHRGGDVGGLALDGLAQGEGHAGGGLGQVFAEDEDRVVLLDVAQGRHRQRAVLQDVADQAQVGQLAGGDAGVVVLGADQFTQGEVAFEAGPRRTDADHALAFQQFGGLVQGRIQSKLLVAQQRLARTVFAVDVAVAEAAAVAEEVVVHRAVEAVLDAADLAVALAGADVAAAGAAMADARGELHVPLAVVALGVGLVGEHAGRADLDQVAGELALQHAILDAAEVDVVVGTVDAQIFAAGVVLVVAHAAVAGDAAVHLVGDERAEVLVLVGALGEAVAALVVAGHHRHVLQVAVTAFLAHRAVVRVVGHQPFDDAFAKAPGFLVVDGDPGLVGGGRHAGHDDAPAGVVLVVVLLHRTLAAGADAAQRRVPAEVGNVEAEGQTGLQQVVCAIDFERLAVYVDSGHGSGFFFARSRGLANGIPWCRAPSGARCRGGEMRWRTLRVATSRLPACILCRRLRRRPSVPRRCAAHCPAPRRPRTRRGST